MKMAVEGSSARDGAYLAELLEERQRLGPDCTHAARLLDQEIERTRQNSEESPLSATSSKKSLPPLPAPLLEIHTGRQHRLQVKVHVPVKDHPNFNFVGKLLGPKGNSFKRLQEETQTKMAILGRGSIRDKKKEEELRSLGDDKHGHLLEDLHVEISAFAPPAEAYRRMATALTEVKRFLVPDYFDEIRQNQLRELAIMNGAKGKLISPIPECQGSRPLSVETDPALLVATACPTVSPLLPARGPRLLPNPSPRSSNVGSDSGKTYHQSPFQNSAEGEWPAAHRTTSSKMYSNANIGQKGRSLIFVQNNGYIYEDTLEEVYSEYSIPPEDIPRSAEYYPNHQVAEDGYVEGNGCIEDYTDEQCISPRRNLPRETLSRNPRAFRALSRLRGHPYNPQPHPLY